MVSLGINDYFTCCWFVNLSKLVKYLRVERYLAAKIGTISWFFFGGSSLLRMVDVVILFCWVSAVF
jgi:hypothetical protein